MLNRAIISVSDKTGVVEFAAALDKLGVKIISTGGTFSALTAANIPAIQISDVTGFPECLDGRVKTLHPKIHAGILALRDDPKHMSRIAELDVECVDLVVVNLYPFLETISKPGATFDDAIENIDIGGPAMLRSAAKNWRGASAVVDSGDYARIIEELTVTGALSESLKRELSYKAFAHTARYDAMISQYLFDKLPDHAAFPDSLTLTYDIKQPLRYGENPHQPAAFYAPPGKKNGLASAQQLNGKDLSYNNFGDAAGALELLNEFDAPTIVAVKHANPCGVGSADDIETAFVKAYECDPVSIFGGIVASNRTIDESTAKRMAELFLEIVIAPDYTDGALAIFRKKKNLRVMKMPTRLDYTPVMKTIPGGLLVQGADDALLNPASELRQVTNVKPNPDQLADAIFGMKVVKHVKSNGIAVVRDLRTLGIGPGQVNRIWSTEMAIARSVDTKNAVLASDAFFPFRDCVDAAAKAGITLIIQPGGSLRDRDSIDACNEHGIAMILTGVRHFKH